LQKVQVSIETVCIVTQAPLVNTLKDDKQISQNYRVATYGIQLDALGKQVTHRFDPDGEYEKPYTFK
jgi:hypothetical protein